MTPQEVLALVAGGAIAGCLVWFQHNVWPRIQASRLNRRTHKVASLDVRPALTRQAPWPSNSCFGYLVIDEAVFVIRLQERTPMR